MSVITSVVCHNDPGRPADASPPRTCRYPFPLPKDFSLASSSAPIAGIWPALLTPLTADLDIDHAEFARHARSLIDAGCAGVTPFGTTGEGPSFSVAERRAAIDALVEGGVPASRILVATGCAALPDVVELTRHAIDVGAAGCLMLPPFFLKGVPDQGLIDAHRWVIDRVADPRLKVMLYQLPQVTGVGLSHHVIRTLLDMYPGTFIGLKDSHGQREASLAYAREFMPPLQVWVGNEPDIPAMASLGTLGAVSGVANVMPRLTRRLVDEHASPDIERHLQRMRDFIGILGGYGMTSAFKGMMAILTGNPGWRRVRPPLAALDDTEFARLAAQFAAFAVDRERE